MFKPGDNVKIRGSRFWFTDRLDGVIAKVIDVTHNGYYVRVGNSRWYIAKEDALPLENE